MLKPQDAQDRFGCEYGWTKQTTLSLVERSTTLAQRQVGERRKATDPKWREPRQDRDAQSENESRPRTCAAQEIVKIANNPIDAGCIHFVAVGEQSLRHSSAAQK